ncbi:N-acetylmuramoyl-L-alanine amidase [Nakamurella silvestris]|nr:N-acetylmuramoyl-L-alanine amidase [Nakamurella silvestris]
MRARKSLIALFLPLIAVTACSAVDRATTDGTTPEGTTGASTSSPSTTHDAVTVPNVVVTPSRSTVTVTSTADTPPATTASDPVTTSETAEPPATPTAPSTTTSAPSTTASSTTASSTTAPPKTTPTTPKPPKNTQTGGTMTKKIVVVDPGHNGANGANPDIINQLVDAGFGQTKPCNTTGTSTNDGYSEAQFNWKVANYVKAELESKGITVVMTRDSNDGVGPCVDKRAAIGNNSDADVVLSIHGDGSSEGDRGFYAMTAEQHPASEAIAEASDRFAVDLRDALVDKGLSPANYLGSNGLWTRSDLAGLNLSQVPTVMVEMGNMRDSADSALMTSDAGQQKIANGLAAGVVQYLISH